MYISSTGAISSHVINAFLLITKFISIFTSHNQRLNNTTDDSVESYPSLESHTNKITIIPVIDWAAIPLWVNQDKNPDLLHESGTWITTDKQISSLAFALKSLKSMVPRFKKNSILIVDPTVEYSDGHYVVVMLDYVHPTVRKLMYDGETTYLANINNQSQFMKLEANHKIFGPIIESRISFFDDD